MDDDVRMGTEDIIETLRKKFERVAEVLDARGRRVWAARVLAGQQTAGRVGAASISKPLSLRRWPGTTRGVRRMMASP